MQKITPFLWFDNQAEEAVQFYTSVFNNSAIGEVRRYPAGGPAPEGSVMSVSFRIENQELVAFNGGPMFSFTPAISLFVDCKTQEEVDELWDKLCEGGAPNQCGWLQDKYGLSWQIIPSVLGELMQGSDREKSGRVVQAMLQMDRIDIAKLRQAYEGA